MTCVSTLAPTCLCLISLKSATESPFLKTTFKRYMKAMASRLMVDIYAYSEWKQTIASMSFDGIPMNIGNLHGMTDVPNTCVLLKRLGGTSMPIILTNFGRVFRVYCFLTA